MNLEIITLWEKDLFNKALTIEPAGMKRKWMDETNQEYAYRCLPLNIANQHGWAIYLNQDVVAKWDGEKIDIPSNCYDMAVSHFGHGILSFSLPFLVRLDPGYNLYITGAPNHHIKGVHPCTGIFEADWAPYSFTMNWRFESKNEYITFSQKDPICFFFPVKRDLVPNTVTKMSKLEDQEKEYIEQYRKFHAQRNSFNLDEWPSGWQKHYFQGTYPDRSKCPGLDHQTKLKLNTFK